MKNFAILGQNASAEVNKYRDWVVQLEIENNNISQPRQDVNSTQQISGTATYPQGSRTRNLQKVLCFYTRQLALFFQFDECIALNIHHII